MKTTRHMPQGSYVWVAVFVAAVLATFAGFYFFSSELWLGVIPISLMVWSSVMAVRSRLFAKCPVCGKRMRARDGTDPLSGKPTLCYDCHRCDTEWIPDEAYPDAPGD